MSGPRGSSLALVAAILAAATPVRAQGAFAVVADVDEVQAFLGGRTGKVVYCIDDGCSWIDLTDMSVHLAAEDYRCADPLISPDGTRVAYYNYEVRDRFNCTPGYNPGNSFIRHLDGGPRVQVGGLAVSGHHAFSPHWWVDPATGDEYIVYNDMSCKDTHTTEGVATWKQRIEHDQPVGDPIKILDHAFDAGLSWDGRYLGEGYYYLHTAPTVDLGGGDGWEISRRMNNGRQACNASWSPDSHRVMHLRLDHDGADIRDLDDNVIQTIWKPSGAVELGTPEFSNHPRYCTFVAHFSEQYGGHLYLGDTETGDFIKIAEGLMLNPHLWVAPDEPLMLLDPASLEFEAVEGEGDPSPQRVEIVNAGVGTLDAVSVDYDVSWLSVTRAGSGEGQTLDNAVDAAGLDPGDYSAEVEVSCGNAANNPRSYRVALQVLPPAPDTEAPEVSVTFPDEDGTVSGQVPVSGTASDNARIALVEVRVDDEEWRAADGTGSWSAPLDTTALEDGAHTVTARATDSSDNQASASVGFAVDNSAPEPSITILSPAGSEVWEVGSEQRIRWSTVSLSDVSLSYSADDGATWERIETSVDASSEGWMSYPWVVPDTPSSACRVFIMGYSGEVPTRSEAFEIRAAASLPDGGQADRAAADGGSVDREGGGNDGATPDGDSGDAGSEDGGSRGGAPAGAQRVSLGTACAGTSARGASAPWLLLLTPLLLWSRRRHLHPLLGKDPRGLDSGRPARQRHLRRKPLSGLVQRILRRRRGVGRHPRSLPRRWLRGSGPAARRATGRRRRRGRRLRVAGRTTLRGSGGARRRNARSGARERRFRAHCASGRRQRRVEGQGCFSDRGLQRGHRHRGSGQRRYDRCRHRGWQLRLVRSHQPGRRRPPSRDGV